MINDPYQAQIDEIFSIVYIAYSGLITRGKIIFQSFIFVEFTVLRLRQQCVYVMILRLNLEVSVCHKRNTHTHSLTERRTQNHKKSVYIRKMIPKISLLRNVRLKGKTATQDFVNAKQQRMADMDKTANWCSLCEIKKNRT